MLSLISIQNIWYCYDDVATRKRNERNRTDPASRCSRVASWRAGLDEVAADDRWSWRLLSNTHLPLRRLRLLLLLATQVIILPVTQHLHQLQLMTETLVAYIAALSFRHR